MPVEVSILSGARQGQRRVLDVNKFKAGSDPSFDIYFDPLVDSAAKDRSVLLCLMDDGWYIQCTGKGDVFVNHTPVVGMMRIRSGSVVRMSEFGPEFEFSIVARGKAAADRAGAPASAMPAPAGAPAPAPLMPPPLTPPEAPRPVDPRPLAPPAAAGGRLPLWIGGSVAVFLVLLMLAALLLPGLGRQPPGSPPEEVAREPVQKPETTPGPAEPVAVGAPVKKEPSAPPSQSPPPAPPTPPAPPPPTSPADLVKARLDGAVLLIQVEKSGHFWPFSTCCAVSENTVLTTAREAFRLAAWRRESGFKIWVTDPAAKLKLAVKDIRVHGLFATLASKPGDWIYCDLALVTVDGQLPKTAALASDEELSRLKEGHSVFCYGFTHEGDAITAEDRLAPVLTPAKVFIITAQRTLPGQPSVLHVKGDIPKSAYGSPVTNEQGKIVAVYGEAASQPGSDAKAAASLLKLHYATVVNPEVVDLWLKKADGKIWISAAELKPPVEAKTDR